MFPCPRTTDPITIPRNPMNSIDLDATAAKDEIGSRRSVEGSKTWLIKFSLSDVRIWSKS